MESQPTFESIPVDQLELDSNNPRLPKSLHGKSEEEILKYMLLDSSLIELMLAIGHNGFFPGEQLLVVQTSKKPNAKYKAVEGNRRLSAVKLLRDPDKASIQKVKVNQVVSETSERPESIPCLIFNSESEIRNYLGYRHITGIKEWKLLEKAKYLSDLYYADYREVSFIEACKDLAKSIGSRRDYVERLVVGYDIFKIIEDNSFYKIEGLNDTTFWFNYIADSLSREHICEYLNIQIDSQNGLVKENLDLDGLRKWVHWFFQRNKEGKTRLIGDSKTLTQLNKVLSDPAAKEAFVSGSLSLIDALDLTDEADQQFLRFITASIKSLEKADSLSLKISIEYDTVREYLNTNRNLLKKIADTIKSKEVEGDEF